MRLFKVVMSLFITGLLLLTNPVSIHAQESGEAVYFYDPLCGDCRAVENEGIIDMLKDDGVDIVSVNVNTQSSLFTAFLGTYDVPLSQSYPIIFAGDTYFYGRDDIIDSYYSGEIYAAAQNPLLDTGEYVPAEYSTFMLILFVIGAGLLDGVNPCAIAMLLLFISIVGFTKNKKVLLTVSISYISAIFLTYFAIGLGLVTILGSALTAFEWISVAIFSFFILLFLFLAIITFYDYLVTRKNQYEDVKNQLPKFIKKFNERVMGKLVKAIEDEETGFKQVLLMVVIPFLIGIVIAITEAACTGQLYFIAMAVITVNTPAFGAITVSQLLYILLFNIMFIMPLIIIAVIVVRAKSVMGVSNFIREHLSIIKLVTSIFFILMVIYFGYLLIDDLRSLLGW